MDAGQFDRDEVLAVLRDVGKTCSRKITVYMEGGGAMAIRGEKVATKDVDLIVGSENESSELKDAFIKIGLEVNDRHPSECRELVDAEILTTSEGMRIDLFVKRVCNKLFLSEGMKERSEPYAEMGGIALRICSREDIFLLKSVTERNRDLEDMMALYRKGIDKEIVLSEVRRQDKLDSQISGRIWETFLLVKLEEMEDRFGISIPWRRELKRIADLKLGCALLLAQIDMGINTVDSISEKLDLNPSQTRR